VTPSGPKTAPGGVAPVGPAVPEPVPTFGRSLAFVGLVAALAAAWGGAVPYVGPLFGFGANGVGAWTWNAAHGLLGLLPGAVGLVAAMLIMGAAGRPASGPARTRLALGGMLAMAAGAWFVIGPPAWPVVAHAGAHFVAAPAWPRFERLVGYSFGPGSVLLACGGLAVGTALGRRLSASGRAGLGAATSATGPAEPVAVAQ